MGLNIYSPAGIRALLGGENAAPLKSLGQNFLVDERVVEQMVEQSGLTAEDGALEIGPGLGALTQQLCAVTNKVAAIEVDKKMIKLLEKTAPGAAVIEADALKADIAEIIAEYLSDSRRVLVFGNLPYYITTPIIMRLVEEQLPIYSITAMVQREAAERLCAPEGSRESGAVTLAVRYRCMPKILFGVSKNSFYPVPKVESSVISLTPTERDKKPKSEQLMFRVIKAAFSQRRKTILNSISAGLAVDKSELEKILADCEIPPLSRAEQLTISNYISISDHLCSLSLL